MDLNTDDIELNIVSVPRPKPQSNGKKSKKKKTFNKQTINSQLAKQNDVKLDEFGVEATNPVVESTPVENREDKPYEEKKRKKSTEPKGNTKKRKLVVPKLSNKKQTVQDEATQKKLEEEAKKSIFGEAVNNDAFSKYVEFSSFSIAHRLVNCLNGDLNIFPLLSDHTIYRKTSSN
jgi:hypothetical protein